MIAGALEIQLFANLARLQKDMNDAKGIVGSAMSQIGRAAEIAKTAIAGLGAGLSVVGLVRFVQNAAEAGDQLFKLSQKTGIAVAELSALKYAATLSDVSTESLGKGMKGLSQRMVEATDATSKAGKLLSTLGVDVRGGAAPAIEKLADAFAVLPDGPTKAALAVEVFGKAGMDMIPLLNQGSEGLRKMRDEALRLGLVMDDETARAAEAFNDNLKVVQMSGERLGHSLLNDLAPGLVRVSRAMKEAAAESGTLMAIWVGMGGVASEALGLNKTETEALSRNLKRAQEEAAKFGANLEPLRRRELLDGLAQPGNMVEASFVKANFQIRLTQSTLDAMAGKYGDQVSRAASQGKGTAGGVNADLEARVRALLGTKDAAEKAAKAMKELGLADAHVVAFLKLEAEMREAVTKALHDGEEARRRQIESIEDEIARQEWQNETLGMTREQIALLVVARLEEKMAILQASGAMETELAQLQEEIDLRKRLAEAVGRGETARSAIDGQNEALRAQSSVWLEISRNAGDFFADLVTNGRSAFGNLRDYVKRFLADMVSLFAQRWILQMGGSLVGGTAGNAIAGMAGQVGQGSLAGSLLSAGGGLLQSGLSSILGGGTGGAVAASELLSMASEAGPYIAAIAAAYALYQAFKDKGENWKGKIGFGANANAYTTTGPFGTQGFEYIAGDDTTNRALQAFMGSTLGIDRQLATRLTPAQIAAISGRLTGAYTTRNDGQPAEFAFGKDDATAGQQLTLEFLQRKYGTIFDEIDSEFAKFIRGYTGKSEDLLKAIGEFAGLLDMLDATGIKGLNITTLRAFQREGEALGETFARITQQYAQFQDLYYTDAEKVAMVQEQVAGVFADLGIAVPASNAEFRALVESLDLSTESGRRMFTALMGIAPAFHSITNAAEAAVARFNSLAATLSPSFGASNARSVLEARVRSWMGLTPGNGEAGGWTVESTIANIGTLIREGRLGEALTYAQSLGGNAVSVLNDMLEAYIAWQTATQNNSNPLAPITRGVGELGDAAERAAAQMQDAKDSLWDYLQSLKTNPSLSPLDPMRQLGVARSEFETLLSLAQGGDLGAAAGLQGAVDRALGIARTVYGSAPGYREFFDWITSAAGEFARPGGGQDMQASIYAESRTGNEILREVRQILLDIRDKGTADGEQVSGAVQNAALASERR